MCNILIRVMIIMKTSVLVGGGDEDNYGSCGGGGNGCRGSDNDNDFYR